MVTYNIKTVNNIVNIMFVYSLYNYINKNKPRYYKSDWRKYFKKN
jgi:hypothetical protein